MYLISFIHSYFPLLAPFKDIATVHFANFWYGRKKNQLFPRRRAQSDESCESVSAQSGKLQSSILFMRQPRLTLEKLRWSLEAVAPQPQSLTFRRPAKLLFFANTHPADTAPPINVFACPVGRLQTKHASGSQRAASKSIYHSSSPSARVSADTELFGSFSSCWMFLPCQTAAHQLCLFSPVRNLSSKKQSATNGAAWPLVTDGNSHQTNKTSDRWPAVLSHQVSVLSFFFLFFLSLLSFWISYYTGIT